MDLAGAIVEYVSDTGGLPMRWQRFADRYLDATVGRLTERIQLHAALIGSFEMEGLMVGCLMEQDMIDDLYLARNLILAELERRTA